MIGNRPAMIATTVIAFGRTRSTAPFRGDRLVEVSDDVTGLAAFGLAARRAPLPCVVEVDQRRHAGLPPPRLPAR